ncbi:MAG: hypothetical protein LIP01_16040, partial [Tannerellaceae bacterium]|nr:hypothetical protein [Tannerellaceae bacterium]
ILTSCHNLDPKIYDKIGEGNFPQNEEDVTSLITGIYGILNKGQYSGFGDIAQQSRWCLGTATTDEFICYWGGSVWDRYRHFQWGSSDAEVTSDKTFLIPVQTITNCVNIVYMIRDIEMDETLKNRYMAKMKCIIALFSYYLYSFYGPVPLVLDTDITLDPNADYIAERSTQEWMIQHIREYAREAADALPVTYAANDYGRVTKGAALMILLKLAMHEKTGQMQLVFQKRSWT